MKAFIVRPCESGVTQAITNGGLRCATLWEYQHLLALVDRREIDELVPIEEDDFGKLDPVYITRKLLVMQLRGAVVRRICGGNFC